MLRQTTLFTLTLTAMSVAHADSLTPVAPADVRLCQASGSTGPQVPCVLQDQTWIQLQRPTDPADRMTIAPSVTAPVGTLANTIVPSYALGLSTAYMPPPSGSAATDAANFAAAQATGAPLIVFQSGTYLVPQAGYAPLRSGQYIRGQSSSLTILRGVGQGTSDYGMLYAISKSDAGISGMTIDYADFPEPQSKAGVLGLLDVAHFHIEDVNLIGFSRYGLNTNTISDFSYSRGRITRSTSPRYADGTIYAKGDLNRCVQVSQNAGPSIRLRFEDVIAAGCGFGVGAEEVDYVRTAVVGFDYGFAYVTDQWPNARAHRFVNVRATGGLSNPVTGGDRDDTKPGCFEIWAKDSIVEGSDCSDMGGDGAAIGGKNVRFINNKFSKLGMFAPANGIVTRYQDDTYNADGTVIANNKVVDTNGSGDGSSLLLPFAQQDQRSSIVVTITGNDFGLTPLPRKGLGEKWSSPGMLIPPTSSGAYSQPSCSILSPIDRTVSGTLRGADAINAATFTANDSSNIPANIRVFAEIREDNRVQFYTQEIDCIAGSTTTIPAGKFSARLITIN